MPGEKIVVNSSYVVQNADGEIDVDTSDKHVVITLPMLNRHSKNKALVIKKVTSDDHNISLMGDGCKIDDGDIFIFGRDSKPDYVTVHYDGNNWRVIEESEY